MPSTGNTANRPLQPGPSLLAASVTVSVSAAPIIARRINSAGYIGRSTAISPASRRERRIQAGKPYPDIDACIARYNLEHEHRELNGNTPEDEYQARIDKDSIVFGPTDAEIHALWMPEVC